MRKFNLAIFGATGLVGQKMRTILEERNLPIENIYFFASKNSAGKTINFQSKNYHIEELSEENLKNKKIDYALCALESPLAKEFLPMAAKYGITSIDNSSAFRMVDDIPLVVPEINASETSKGKGIIASPNCSTIQSVMALYPIYKKYGIKRIIYTTYQAVTGSGIGGIEDLYRGIWAGENDFYPHQIAYNVLPHIDDFLDDGYTKEEMKMVDETKKILNDQSLRITATAARVPVLNSHMVAINVETEKPFDIDEIFEDFRNEPGIVLYDDVKNNIYPMPTVTTGKDEVYVGRIRRDNSIENGINFLSVADNTRKGAALNTIQILEYLIEN
ncbi:aspartate-semialdehyde dehydrogenase [Anaerosphaera multitolerans]|uniref:Aspartate-semialdehyde dehydrogenase n=1 Tax=Anaerosphaera multitolerans TaxID=2487351 RepID=A0A437S5B5_9FIRM|nr:aspartate-semialdehyde dehydrogenase [Anaerosphaera multitolerans]RVU54096.1 aspartate-semialdehyde dehydrogenase [Anaerosphaera multitolerans]